MEKIQKEGFEEVAVIVGRFQVDELTEGHKCLFDSVIKNHKKVICAIGLSPCKCTRNNPLDFSARKVMINETYPDIEICYINDVASNLLWSNRLDILVRETVGDKTVCMYGGRDSFLKQYCGAYRTRELLPEYYISGTLRRKEIARNIDKSPAFRRGVIWATENQYPACLPTVDMGIFNTDYSKILLGRKPGEDRFRFVGGFVSPGETYEDAVIRETKEEAAIDVNHMVYVRSFKVNDWRYAGETNKITTCLFTTNDWNSAPLPGDDIEELRWFPFNGYIIDSIVKEHLEMMEYLLKMKGLLPV